MPRPGQYFSSSGYSLYWRRVSNTDRRGVKRCVYDQSSYRHRTWHPGVAAAGQGQLGADPLGMFAQLLERADARAERVSEYADRLAIAGRICERYADAMTAPQR